MCFGLLGLVPLRSSVLTATIVTKMLLPTATLLQQLLILRSSRRHMVTFQLCPKPLFITHGPVVCSTSDLLSDQRRFFASSIAIELLIRVGSFVLFLDRLYFISVPFACLFTPLPFHHAYSCFFISFKQFHRDVHLCIRVFQLILTASLIEVYDRLRLLLPRSRPQRLQPRTPIDSIKTQSLLMSTNQIIYHHQKTVLSDTRKRFTVQCVREMSMNCWFLFSAKCSPTKQ